MNTLNSRTPEMMVAMENSKLQSTHAAFACGGRLAIWLLGAVALVSRVVARAAVGKKRHHGSFVSPPSLHGNILRDVGFAPVAVRFAKRNLARVERCDV